MENASPIAEVAEVGAATENPVEQLTQTETETPAEIKEEAKEEAKEEKKEKTPEEREIARLRRRVDNLTRRLYQGEQKGLQAKPIESNNQAEQNDSEALTLSRAELQKLIDTKAREIAPTIKQQQDEIEHRRGIVEKLANSWGKEKFDAFAADLNDAFDGLQDQSGKPKPATDAIFESDDPQALIEYLADPENAAEAEALGRMNAVRAGIAVAKLSQRIASTKAEDKPKPSKAAAPIEPVRGAGTASSSAPTDIKAYVEWANKKYGRM